MSDRSRRVRKKAIRPDITVPEKTRTKGKVRPFQPRPERTFYDERSLETSESTSRAFCQAEGQRMSFDWDTFDHHISDKQGKWFSHHKITK